MQLLDSLHRPALLVSVRNAEEARAALVGGADVIDVKEPARGSLGAADPMVIAAVISAVEGRAPVTAAMGELVDLERAPSFALPPGVAMFKIGLAGCGQRPDWQSRWHDAIRRITSAAHATRHAVAVAYSDWRAANAPKPEHILAAAVEYGCPALLVDTWDKSAGNLFDHWPADELRHFVQSVHSQRMAIVLAGSLTGEAVATAACLHPDLVAVRTAACDAGRNGAVSRRRVAALKNAIRTEPSLLSPPQSS